MKQTIIYQPWVVGLSRTVITLGCFYDKKVAETAASSFIKTNFTASTLSDDGITELILLGDHPEDK